MPLVPAYPASDPRHLVVSLLPLGALARSVTQGPTGLTTHVNSLDGVTQYGGKLELPFSLVALKIWVVGVDEDLDHHLSSLEVGLKKKKIFFQILF